MRLSVVLAAPIPESSMISRSISKRLMLLFRSIHLSPHSHAETVSVSPLLVVFTRKGPLIREYMEKQGWVGGYTKTTTQTESTMATGMNKHWCMNTTIKWYPNTKGLQGFVWAIFRFIQVCFRASWNYFILRLSYKSFQNDLTCKSILAN